jgi:hypothetical protein
MELVDYRASENAFFVRTTSGPAAVAAAFGPVTFVDAVVDGETAFLTDTMTESEFADKAAQIVLVNRIRLG